VVLDLELCIGCGFCMYACPFGVIDMSPDGKKAVKCDLCRDRTAAGDPPACVAACPTGAIQFEEMDEALRQRRSEVVAGCTARLASVEPRGEQGESGKARCDVCGDPYAPAKLLDRLRSKLPEPVPAANVCPCCRRTLAAAELAPEPQPAVAVDADAALNAQPESGDSGD
jgi:ferredoxin